MIGLLHTSGQLLLPGAISPLGNIGPLLRRHTFGTSPSSPYHFPTTRPNASIMHSLISSHPCPNGIVPLAKANWLKNKPKSQHFYGGSYTCPTPLEYAQQQFGLAIGRAAATHISNATHGKLLPPDDPYDDDFTPPSQANEAPVLDGPTDEDAPPIFHFHDHQQTDGRHPHIQPPPGFFSTPPRTSPSAQEAPRILRRDFVNPASLWDSQAQSPPETALFGSLADDDSGDDIRRLPHPLDSLDRIISPVMERLA